MYRVSQKKIPPDFFWHFLQNVWEFLVQILHAYCNVRSYLLYTTNFYSVICSFD